MKLVILGADGHAVRNLARHIAETFSIESFIDRPQVETHLSANGETAGFVLAGQPETDEQARALDNSLNSRDVNLDLVLVVESRNLPGEQADDTDSAVTYYQTAGRARLLRGDAGGDLTFAAAKRILNDHIRSRHPGREPEFPPIRAVEPEEQAPPMPTDAEPASQAEPAIDALPSASPISETKRWKQAAESRGRIKRRSARAGAVKKKGRKPK